MSWKRWHLLLLIDRIYADFLLLGKSAWELEGGGKSLLYHLIDMKDKSILFLENGRFYTGSIIKLKELADEIENEKPYIKGNENTQSFRLQKLVFLMTEECNFRCRYCYLDYGNFRDTYYPETLTFEKAKEILKQILLIKKEGIENILFFGGEPLLAFSIIKEIVEYISSYCESHGIVKPHFGLVTNGMLLDKKKWKVLCQYHFKVKVSMDGDKTIHDRVRINGSGAGTWYGIEKCVRERIKENANGLLFEMTLNRLHLELLKEDGVECCLNSLKNIGFRAGTFACVEDSKDKSLDFRKSDRNNLIILIEKMVDFCFKEFELDQSLFCIDVIQAIQFLFAKKVEYYDCRVGCAQFTVTAPGDIIPCTAYAHTPASLDLKSPSAIENQEKENADRLCSQCWIHGFCKSYCVAKDNTNKIQKEKWNVRCIYVQAIYESVLKNIVKLNECGKMDLITKKLKECQKMMKNLEESMC